MDKNGFTEKKTGEKSGNAVISENLSSRYADRDGIFYVLDEAQLEKRKQERYSLLYISEKLKDILNQNIVVSGNVVISDEEGYVFFSREQGPSNHLFGEGTCLSSICAGYNAVGESIRNLEIVKVVGKEHELPFFHDYVSLAMPIKLDNTLIGCLGIFSPISDSKDLQSGITESIFKTAIFTSSKMLETRQNIDELQLLREFSKHQERREGVIVLDASSKVFQLNLEAEVILGVAREDLLGKNIRKYMEDKESSLLSDQESGYTDIQFRTSHGKVTISSHICPIKNADSLHLGWKIQFYPAKRHNKFSPALSSTKFGFNDIVGENREFKRLIKLARAIARSPSNVLINGSSGTGKELFAQAIHSASDYAHGPFVAINCAAIPRDLIESELFGYVEGAFTGARKGGLQGKFVQANNGTLFLDEIGDMPFYLQSKLLRVLQERTIIPVGGCEEIPVNIRIISATNQDLSKMINENQFRSDLYYRLNVINLQIPELKDRKDDIPLLVKYFCQVYNEQLGKEIVDISPAALDIMMQYKWPGNVRELENVMEMAANLADDIIDLEHLPACLVKEKEKNILRDEEKMGGEIVSLEDMEKREIIKALKAFQGNISQTASALDIGRTTLYRKIKKFDLLQYLEEGR